MDPDLGEVLPGAGGCRTPEKHSQGLWDQTLGGWEERETRLGPLRNLCLPSSRSLGLKGGWRQQMDPAWIHSLYLLNTYHILGTVMAVDWPLTGLTLVEEVHQKAVHTLIKTLLGHPIVHVGSALLKPLWITL